MRRPRKVGQAASEVSHAFLLYIFKLFNLGIRETFSEINAMKTILSRFLMFLYAFTFLAMASSCKDEKSEVGFYLSCTEDVLEYMQATVRYQDKSGSVIERTLTADDFEITKETKATDITSTLPMWKTKIKYDRVGVENTCDVSFTQIKPLNEEKSKYIFFVALDCTGSYETDNTQNSNFAITAPVPVILSESLFKKELDKLVDKGLHKTVQIDSKGKIIIN